MEICPVLPQSHPIHRALTGEGKEDEGPTETAKGWLGIHSLSSSSKPHSVQSGKRVQRDPPIQAAPGSLCFLVLRHVQQVTPFPLATSGRDRMMESPRRLGRGWGEAARQPSPPESAELRRATLPPQARGDPPPPPATASRTGKRLSQTRPPLPGQQPATPPQSPKPEAQRREEPLLHPSGIFASPGPSRTEQGRP